MEIGKPPWCCPRQVEFLETLLHIILKLFLSTLPRNLIDSAVRSENIFMQLYLQLAACNFQL